MTRLETVLHLCEDTYPHISSDQQKGLSIAIGVLQKSIEFERKDRMYCNAEECEHNRECKCMKQGIALNMDHQCCDYRDAYSIDTQTAIDEEYQKMVDETNEIARKSA